MVSAEVWGPVVWTFLHTLAAKLKEDSFPVIRADIVGLIKTVCHEIPCPNCQEHASEYMSKVYWDRIKCKKDLITMLWEFHNIVNMRLRKPLFSLEDCEARYQKAMTSRVFAAVVGALSHERQGVVGTLGSKVARRGAIAKISTYLTNNSAHFDP